MPYEYLLFNLIVITGPVLASFDTRTHFVSQWPRALAAALVILPPFVIWDILVTDRHWWFNPSYTIDSRLLGLPPGEWLFFLTVPFACLFVWEILPLRSEARTAPNNGPIIAAVVILLTIGVALLLLLREYSALVCFAAALCLLLDRMLKTNLIVRRKSLLFGGILIVFILIFNTYLTARPLVLYGETYQLGLRIGTIPIEDFVYGLAHIFSCVIIYERLKRRRS